MKKLMIIEDEENLQFILQEILSEEGYEVEVFGDGLSALDHLRKNNLPDLILTDLTLPNMKGKDFIIQLKSLESVQKIPVIIMSGNLDIDVIANEMQVAGHLKKPFQVSEMLKLIESYL